MGNNDMVTLGNELILTGIEFQKDVVIQQMITAAITINRNKKIKFILIYSLENNGYTSKMSLY